MIDLGNDWVLLAGTPLLKQGLMGNEGEMVVANKATKKCTVCVEGPRCVVADAKGKKVHLAFDVADVARAEVQQLSFRGLDLLAGPAQVVKFFAVVSLRGGTTYSFGHAKDPSDFHQQQLVAALLPPDG